MANPSNLPNSNAEAVDQNRRMTKEWRDFFLRQASETDVAELRAFYTMLAARVTALEEDEGGTFVINGPLSIQVDGSPESGAVTLRLRGDTQSPGATYHYSTDENGAKGWHAVADAFLEGDNISLVVGLDGRTTISTTGGGGVLPMVTGEIYASQPRFMYFDDGSLLSVQVE